MRSFEGGVGDCSEKGQGRINRPRPEQVVR